MKKAYIAEHEQQSQREDRVVQFTSQHLVQVGYAEDGNNKFEINLPVVSEPVPFEHLVEVLLPQFLYDRKRTERFVDDMISEMRRQQLADAIASMIRI